jgi:parallel beta-helix repeat protein
VESCPDCYFKGNAIEDSSQRAIIVHGSHNTLIEDNVMYQIRGAGLYVEDGNEMENMFRNNVNICHDSSANRYEFFNQFCLAHSPTHLPYEITGTSAAPVERTTSRPISFSSRGCGRFP